MAQCLFRGNLGAWLEEDMEYKATWIYDRFVPMGFGGGYEIVKRAVHAINEEHRNMKTDRDTFLKAIAPFPSSGSGDDQQDEG